MLQAVVSNASMWRFSFIFMTQAVVSNASMWDTLRLLPEEARPPAMQSTAQQTPMTPSFMHLHLGFDATGDTLQLA